MFLVALVATVLGQSCPSYNCANPNITTTGVCYSTSGTSQQTISLTQCQFGLACPYRGAMSSSVSCIDALNFTRYVGEFCESNTDCRSYWNSNGSCINNVCVAGSACVDTGDCSRNFFCDNGLCVDAYPVNSPCQYYYQCELGSHCDSGVCTSSFSKANGVSTTAVTDKDNGGYAPTCFSSYATFVSSTQTFVCSLAPVSNSTKPIQCNNGAACYAKDGVNYKQCQCAPDGNGYCPLFEGDSIVQYMSYYLQVFHVTYGCNNLHPFSYACIIANNALGYLSVLDYAMLYFDDYWVLRNNYNYCEQQTILNDYFNVLNQDLAGLTNLQNQCNVFVSVPTIASNASLCILKNTNIFNSHFTTYLQVADCPTGQFCLHNRFLGQGICTPINNATRNSGEYCASNGDCINNKCVNGLCAGAGLGQPCVAGNCSQGYFCNNYTKVCQALATNGMACNGSIHCSTFLECNNNICVPYFSIPSGSSVQCQFPPYLIERNLACASGYAKFANNSCTCYAAVPDKTYPPSCGVTSGNICPLYTSNTTDPTLMVNTTCECGTDGNYYCPMTELTVYHFYAINYLQRLNTTNRVCNGDFELTAGCFAYDQTALNTYYYFVSNLMYAHFNTVIRSSGLGVIQSLLPEYYTAYQAVAGSPPVLNLPYIIQNDSGIMIALATIVMSLVI